MANGKNGKIWQKVAKFYKVLRIQWNVTKMLNGMYRTYFKSLNVQNGKWPKWPKWQKCVLILQRQRNFTEMYKRMFRTYFKLKNAQIGNNGKKGWDGGRLGDFCVCIQTQSLLVLFIIIFLFPPQNFVRMVSSTPVTVTL